MHSRNKDFLKMFFAALCVISVLAFQQGCASDTAIVDIGGKAVEKSTDRFANHSAIRAEEETTKRKKIELDSLRAQVELAQSQSVKIEVTTPEQAAIFGMLEMGKAMSRAVVALASKDKNEYGLATTPMPKGVVGESFDSLGEAAAKVANTPAALILSSGYAMVGVAKEVGKSAGDRTTTTGDNNDTSSRNNTTTTTTTTGAEAPITVTPTATETVDTTTTTSTATP